MLLAAIVVNALSILILYALVYSVFYKINHIEERQHEVERVNSSQDIQHTNLIKDINYNSMILKAYLNREQI
jgi:hypothetical protein|uniref:Uncharacterized protein n=1 Tax=viral metagenome TaxID=1070528 RepID=A0A6C0BPJ8_9ZZZZ